MRWSASLQCRVRTMQTKRSIYFVQYYCDKQKKGVSNRREKTMDPSNIHGHNILWLRKMLGRLCDISPRQRQPPGCTDKIGETCEVRRPWLETLDSPQGCLECWLSLCCQMAHLVPRFSIQKDEMKRRAKLENEKCKSSAAVIPTCYLL